MLVFEMFVSMLTAVISRARGCYFVIFGHILFPRLSFFFSDRNSKSSFKQTAARLSVVGQFVADTLQQTFRYGRP